MHTLVETPEFIAAARKLLSEDEWESLRLVLSQNPKAGAVIQGTGGFRKLRLARERGGKSGGYRVIYYYHHEALPLSLLTVYAKNAKENLTPAERNHLKQLADSFSEYGNTNG